VAILVTPAAITPQDKTRSESYFNKNRPIVDEKIKLLATRIFFLANKLFNNLYTNSIYIIDY